MYGQLGMWEQYEHAIEMSYWCMEMAKKKRDKNLKKFFQSASIGYRDKAFRYADIAREEDDAEAKRAKRKSKR